MNDLNTPGIAKAIAENILIDIDEYAVEKYNDGHRSHLGASLIGHKCSAYLWFVFRWVKAEQFSGRMLRLFNRGHREEERFIEYLEGIGCKVWYEDYSGFVFDEALQEYAILKSKTLDDATGFQMGLFPSDPDFKKHVCRAKADGLKFPQFRISDCKGHFGGSMDAVILLPEKYQIEKPILGEFKTNKTGAEFNKLKKDGLRLTKEQHFCQTSTYGKKNDFGHVLYMNVDKNTDDIHIEIAKLDHKLGEQMIDKANRIIFSDKRPARLSDNPTNHDCGYCNFQKICHYGAEPEKNCRSCSYAKPVDNAEWFCEVHSSLIPKEFIKQGCASWSSVV